MNLLWRCKRGGGWVNLLLRCKRRWINYEGVGAGKDCEYVGNLTMILQGRGGSGSCHIKISGGGNVGGIESKLLLLLLLL